MIKLIDILKEIVQPKLNIYWDRKWKGYQTDNIINNSKTPFQSPIYEKGNNQYRIPDIDLNKPLFNFIKTNNIPYRKISPELTDIYIPASYINVVEKINENKTTYIPNINYYQRILDQSNGLSIQSRQYYQKIINSVKKQGNNATSRQKDILARIETGEYKYASTNEIEVLDPTFPHFPIRCNNSEEVKSTLMRLHALKYTWVGEDILERFEEGGGDREWVQIWSVRGYPKYIHLIPGENKNLSIKTSKYYYD